MANGEDGRKSPWSSWLAPGDVRRAGTWSPHQSLDSDAKRQVSQERHEQSSQLEQHGYGISAIPKETFNPLVAFKRFVDDQFTAITEFPSNVTELKRHSRELDAMHETQRQALKRWTGSGYFYPDLEHMSPTFAPKGHQEAKNLAGMLISEAEWRNQDIPTGKILALFEDTDFNPNHVIEANSPWPFYYIASSEHGQQSPTPASPTQWLSVNWFKHNPYSPVNLEADTMLSQYDTKWRNAFEDLLEASLDKPMTSRDREGGRPLAKTAISTWRGPGLDWMLSLQCRGILPPQLPSMWSHCRMARYHSVDSAQRGLGMQVMGRADLDQLVYEIGATTLPIRVVCDSFSEDDHTRMMRTEEIEFNAEEAETEDNGQICPRHAEQSPEDYAYETSLAERYYRDQISGYGEATPSPNRRPYALGRAIGQAARQSETEETELTELDLYDHAHYAQRIQLLEEQNARRFMEARRDDGSNVDESARQETPLNDYIQQLKLLEEQNAGRFMQEMRDEGIKAFEAAKKQAARAFADEENGLGEDSGAGRQPLRGLCDSDTMARYNEERSEDVTAARSLAWARMYAEEVDDLTEEVGHLMRQGEHLDEEQDALRSRMDKLAMSQKVLLERLEAREREQTPRMLEQEAPMADRSLSLPVATDSGRPQVLSTLTTTQTTRLPDGSVKTTVVLKRRFADGGEETQESTQTSFDKPASAAHAVGQELPKERSWFWS